MWVSDNSRILHVISYQTVYCYMYAMCLSWGGTQMARGGIRLVHGHTKSTLITYFSGMKTDPKYMFLHVFFLICPSCPFQICVYDQKKHTLFSNFARFCTPKWCTLVQCLVLKNNPNYVNFWTSLIPPSHSSAPQVSVCGCIYIITHVRWECDHQ